MFRFGVRSEDDDLDWRFVRQWIADLRPGWTLDYIDNLSLRDLYDVINYANGKAKATEKNNG